MEKFDLNNIKAIIGLGNPGQKYYKNRHSIGFRIIDKLAEKINVPWNSAQNMEYVKAHPIYLIKPQTFMNSSGNVIPFLTSKGIQSDQILVIHDELEKDFGNISIKLGGSAKGHNGLRSIMLMINKDFWRLRFGIGRPENKEDVSNYVLSNFSEEEEKLLDGLILHAVNLILQT